MAQLLTSLPDDQAQRILQDFCVAYKYQAIIGTDDNGNPIPNPQAPMDFVCDRITDYIKDIMKGVEVPQLAETDRQTARDEINSIKISVTPA